MKKAAVTTLGCKVNQVESNAIMEQLEAKGYEIVDFSNDADLYIINTCTVTNRTDYKSRNLIRQALSRKEINPEVKIIVTGCYAQKDKQAIEKLGKIDLIVDNQAKINSDEWLDNVAYDFRDINQADSFNWVQFSRMHERTRAFIKIEDGCNYYCAYCAVPYGRGRPRSLELDKVVAQVQALRQKDYHEIVLTGVNLGLYKDETSGINLGDLVKILANIDSALKIRLSSIEPDLWNNDLLSAIKNSSNICLHFHLPLQSGSDSVLKRMKRRYTAEQISDLVCELRKIKPHCAIGMDVICGFPGETEAEFTQSFELIKSLPVAYLHVFGFSPRKATPAATMPSQITGSVIKERVRIMTDLSKQKKTEYQNELISEEVLLSGIVEKNNTLATALSDHYIRIYKDAVNQPVNTSISGKAVRKYKDGILIN